jgi:glycosyltransferase involved in cell wall biosynthesis
VGRLAINLSVLSPRSTGVNTYAQSIYPHLEPLHPVVLAPEPVPAMAWEPVPPGMSASAGSRGHLKRLLWTQFALPQRLRGLGTDLLFSPVPEGPVASGVRFVATLHDCIPLRYARPLSNLTFYFKSWLPLVMREAQHAIANSEATAREAVELLGVPASRVTAIPLAYDSTRFFDRQLLRSRRFIFLGRRDPHKNLERLLQAFAALRDRELQLLLIGPGSAAVDDRLRTQIAELGLEDRVETRGYAADAELPQILGSAMALVLPSLWEGFGLPVLEAMASGTPVITSTAGALPEVAGDAGLQVDPLDVPALSEAMRQVASDGGLREQLRQRGLLRAAGYRWERTGRQTREVLERFL